MSPSRRFCTCATPPLPRAYFEQWQRALFQGALDTPLISVFLLSSQGYCTDCLLRRTQTSGKLHFHCNLETIQAANDCRWLSLGIHVITPNKRMGSGPLQDYLAVKEGQRRYGVHFLAEVCSFSLLGKDPFLSVQHPVSDNPSCVASPYGSREGHIISANCALTACVRSTLDEPWRLPACAAAVKSQRSACDSTAPCC